MYRFFLKYLYVQVCFLFVFFLKPKIIPRPVGFEFWLMFLKMGLILGISTGFYQENALKFDIRITLTKFSDVPSLNQRRFYWLFSANNRRSSIFSQKNCYGNGTSAIILPAVSVEKPAIFEK